MPNNIYPDHSYNQSATHMTPLRSKSNVLDTRIPTVPVHRVWSITRPHTLIYRENLKCCPAGINKSKLWIPYRCQFQYPQMLKAINHNFTCTASHYNHTFKQLIWTWHCQMQFQYDWNKELKGLFLKGTINFSTSFVLHTKAQNSDD